jgi:nitrate/nitrite transport system substrate-binding protein
MSIFDPFEAARMEEGPTCICGRHRSQAEHDYQSRLMLQCVPVESDRQHKRFDGVMAARALRSSVGRAPRG